MSQYNQPHVYVCGIKKDYCKHKPDPGPGPTPEIDPYEGPYVVIPKPFIEQILETKDLRCIDDITVEEIPFELYDNGDGKEALIGWKVMPEYVAPYQGEKLINKVIYDDMILFDLSEDTVEAKYMAKGKTAHTSNGGKVIGIATMYVENHTLHAPAGFGLRLV